MSVRSQTAEDYRRRSSDTISSVSGPIRNGSSSSISQVSDLERGPRLQISHPRTTDYSTFADEPLGLESTHSWNRASSGPSKNPGNFSSNRVEPNPNHGLRIINAKRTSHGSRDKDDSKTPVADRLMSSKPKYELVFSRTLRNTERHHDRGIASTNVAGSPSSFSRIPSKPFRCPKAHCNRTFSNESALKYHSKHGYCSSLNLSQIYPSSSSTLTDLNHFNDENGMATVTSSPADISPSTFPPKKISGIPTVAITRDVVGKQPESLASDKFSRHIIGSVDTRSSMKRGQSIHTSHRSNSMPNSPKSKPSLPSWLTAFPPPPPFGFKKLDSEKQHQQEHLFSEYEAIRPKKQVSQYHGNEWAKKESGQSTFGSPHLSRSLSTSRPSERDPVLGRPYSQFPSRPPSIRTSSGMPPTTISFSSSYLRFPTKSSHPSHSPIKPVKNTTSYRLANPLPLPPHNPHPSRLRAAREREWGKIEKRNSVHSHTQALSPRTPSPQISFRRFSRPPSPRPSSISSSIYSFSRKSSLSSLSRPSSSPSSLRYSPNSSPSLSSLLPSFIRSSTPVLDPSPSPRPTQRLPLRSVQRDRPLSWREKVRQGFWNRRGDFLTEDGFIVYAPPDRAFPDDLATYPKENEGYQDHELEFTRYVPRPELPGSLPRRGRPPERPYDSFIVYVYK